MRRLTRAARLEMGIVLPLRDLFGKGQQRELMYTLHFLSISTELAILQPCFY